MALLYRITKRSNAIGDKENQYILQAVNTRTIDLHRLSNYISNECRLA
ncbi:hypothetical protein [Polaribacter sp. IC073]|nr:hypothetical protein [Polaribacter sp. IC073]